jgi:LPPG:FO 2-phospho-L-lactate transferase
MPRVTVLAGGVGGARFMRGLLACLPPADVTIVGNVGDDLEHWGLSISPDLDTLLYTLTGRIHPQQGWGVAGDPREAMAAVAELGGVDWFVLGDRDIGLHLVRTERLRAGEPLSAITADLARRLGLGAGLLPASDDRLRTRIVTPARELAFQEWLVGRRAAHPVSAVRLEGVPGARPAPGVLDAIENADRIVLAPSNPFVSLDPILAVDGLRAAVESRREQVVAITPMIGGRAVKGPLAGMLDTLGHEVGALGVARLLAPLAAAFVVDSADGDRAEDLRALGLRVACVSTLMHDAESAAALARTALAL